MALVAIADIRTYLGISATATDALLTFLRDLVEGEIDAITGRNLGYATYTNEVMHYEASDFDAQYNPPLDVSQDYPELFLVNYPVQTLVLSHNGVVIDAENYTLDETQGVVKLFRIEDDTRNQLTASYTAGYAYTGSTYVTPQDLKLLVLDGVKQAFLNSATANQGSGNVKSKRTGTFQVTYGDSNQYSMLVGSASSIVKLYIGQNSHIINKYKRHYL